MDEVEDCEPVPVSVSVWPLYVIFPMFRIVLSLVQEAWWTIKASAILDEMSPEVCLDDVMCGIY